MLLGKAMDDPRADSVDVIYVGQVDTRHRAFHGVQTPRNHAQASHGKISRKAKDGTAVTGVFGKICRSIHSGI